MVKPVGNASQQAQRAAIEKAVHQFTADFNRAASNHAPAAPKPAPRDAAKTVVAAGPDGKAGAKARLKALAGILANADPAYAREVLAEIRKLDPDADRTWLRADIAEEMALRGELNGGERSSIEEALRGSPPASQSVSGDHSYDQIEDHRLSPNHPANNTDAKTDPLTSRKIDPKDLDKLQHGSASERLNVVAKLLKAGVPASELKAWLSTHGGKDKIAEKILASMDPLSEITDPGVSIQKKAVAVITLMSTFAGESDRKIASVINKYLPVGAAGAKFTEALQRLFDPKKSPTEKIKAGVDALTAAKDMGVSLTGLKASLSRKTAAGQSLEPVFRILGDAATIVDGIATCRDPKKSSVEKLNASKDVAMAVLDLAATVPGLRTDLQSIKKFMQEIGVPPEVVPQVSDAVQAELGKLPKAVTDKLPAGYAPTAKEFEQLKALSADPEMAKMLGKALGGMKDPKAIEALLSSLSQHGTNKVAQKAILEVVGGMGAGVADEVLLANIDGKTGAQVLGELLPKLDASAQKAVATILKSFDADSAKSFLTIVDKIVNDPGTGTKFLNKLLPLMQHADGKMLSNIFKLYDKVLAKYVDKLGARTAFKLFKGVFKIIPMLGAIPAGYDAYQLGTKAFDPKLPAEIRVLAYAGAKLNAGDAVLSIVEPFIAEFGVPIAVDVGIAVGEVVIDVLVSDQIDKFEADPQHYSAPVWLKGIAGALGVSSLVSGDVTGFGMWASGLFD